MDEPYDVIVIGAGPAGCAAALYTARAELRTLLLDRPGKGGALGAAEHIANFPGAPGPISGAELVKIMRQQAQSFGAESRTGVVISVDFDSDPRVVCTAEDISQARAVVIATGALERKTKVKGEEEFLGRGVSTCVTCDAAFYRGMTVIVAGNDDYAAEESLALARFADKIHFMAPTATPAISPDLLAGLQEHPQIDLRRGWRLREIIGDDRVRGTSFQTAEGEEYVEADGVFIYLGGARPTTSFLGGRLPVNEEGAIIVGRDFSTRVPRVYAVGDVTAGHIRQAAVAAAEGCIAALAIEMELRGRARNVPDYH